MSIHKVNLQWNLPVKCLYIEWICGETYQMKCLYIEQISGETHQWNVYTQSEFAGKPTSKMYIHKANLQWNLPVKCLYIKRTYITLHNTPNKISKNLFMSFGHYYKYFGKKTKFKSKNTTPGEQKGEAIVYSVQQPLNLILYRSKFTCIQY